MRREEYAKYIHELTVASSVKKVCEDLRITRTNVSSGKAADDKMQEVAEELTRRIQDVFKKYGK